MRLRTLLLGTVILGLLAVPAASCSSGSDESANSENEIVTVERGDLSVQITAAGNLALARSEDVPVELFYGQSGTAGTKGTIGEVFVEEGDTVEEGQVLATIDPDEWADQLAALQDQVTARERSLVDAQIAMTQAEQSLENARDTSDEELAVLNAKVNLDQAQRNLNTAISAIDYEAAEAALNKARAWYDYLERQLQESTSENTDDLVLKLETAKENLDAAQTTYDNVLSGYDSQEVAMKKNQVQAAEITLAQKQRALEDTTQDIALAELQLTRKQGAVADAEEALATAKEDLENAQNKSPEIKAPFAGFITQVNVQGGDEVVNGTVAMQIADPNKFEADILVSEMDIPQVELGGQAWVEVDAMNGLSLPASVTHVAPTATIQSGVVNYLVNVEVESLDAVMREAQQARQQALADAAAGQVPEPLQQALAEGRITQEQLDAIMQQMQSAAGQAGQARPQAAAPANFQLREGLTVTVSIIVQEKTDILLVPNAAITVKQGQSTVQVVTASGSTEERTIQTGITDYQSTEVTEGLSEGDKVVVPQGTAATSTSTSTTPNRRPGAVIFGPGR